MKLTTSITSIVSMILNAERATDGIEKAISILREDFDLTCGPFDKIKELNPYNAFNNMSSSEMKLNEVFTSPIDIQGALQPLTHAYTI